MNKYSKKRIGFPLSDSGMTMSPIQDSAPQPWAVVESATSHKKYDKILNIWQRTHQDYQKQISN